MTITKETEMSAKPETAERDELIRRLENAAHRKGELWERCQGKSWPKAESDEFFRLRDETLPALRAALLAADGAGNGEVVYMVCEPNEASWRTVEKWKYDEYPQEDRMTIYTRPQQAAQVAQPLTPIQVRDGIADWLEANMAHREFWTPEVVELIRSIEINGIGKDQS